MFCRHRIQYSPRTASPYLTQPKTLATGDPTAEGFNSGVEKRAKTQAGCRKTDRGGSRYRKYHKRRIGTVGQGLDTNSVGNMETLQIVHCDGWLSRTAPSDEDE